MPQKLNQKYRQAAEEFARRVTSTLGSQVDSIVLYGSVARGKARLNSDIDILVVSPDSCAVRSKVNDIREEFTFQHSYTFFASLAHFNHKELEWHTRVRSPFIRNVFEEGVILYDNGTFSRVCEEATAGSRMKPWMIPDTCYKGTVSRLQSIGLTMQCSMRQWVP